MGDFGGGDAYGGGCVADGFAGALEMNLACLCDWGSG